MSCDDFGMYYISCDDFVPQGGGRYVSYIVFGNFFTSERAVADRSRGTRHISRGCEKNNAKSDDRRLSFSSSVLSK